MTTSFDRDTMMNAPAKPVANTSMVVLNAIQDSPAFAQVLGTAVAFLAIAEEYGIDPQDAFTATKNMLAAESEERPEFKAVFQYVREELAAA